MSGRRLSTPSAPLAQVDEGQRQLPLDLANAPDHLGAERLAGEVIVAADQQPLRPAVEGHHAARLADADVQIGAALGHAGNPSPINKARVS